jgi:photosystem II stability/assembly factor-like uncharacterized protein
VALATLLMGAAGSGTGQTETIYMSVLNSRAHRIGAADNPLVGLFVSSDRGATWVHRGWREYIRTFYTEEGPDGTIWSACGNGVLRSTDGGASWKITTGWEITEVLKVDVDPSDPSTVYAATAYGIFKTTDRGDTWLERTNGFHRKFSSDVLVDASRTRRLFAASEEGLYCSRDSGSSWSICGLQGMAVRTIVQLPSRPQVLWAGTEDDGVFCSTDGGVSWQQRINGLSHHTVYSIAIDSQNPTRIWLGTHGGGVYRCDDEGMHWQQSVQGLEELVVHAVLVLPSAPDVVFAGTINGGLYRSSDGGKTWTFDSQPLAQVWGLSSR